MENVLVINAGSSSLKYQLMNMEDTSIVANGIVERIGIPGTKLVYKKDGSKKEKLQDMSNHQEAIQAVIDVLTDKEDGVIKSLSDIKAVGHRVVHGGEEFHSSVLIDEDVIHGIESVSDLAPLHNPANLMVIHACRDLMPNTPMVAVFDTAFHQTMPPHAYIYGLPYNDYTDLKIRRYGFHGTSHSYVSKRMAEIMKRPIEELKIVTCHLGNGSSVAAVKHGESIDTSMGMTPLEGVIMGTRSGSIDPAIFKYLAEKRNMTTGEVDSYLNKESGVAGISGVSSDFRDLNDAADDGNERAKLALEAHAYGVKKYIGAYATAMGGLDAIVFTGGVGENDQVVRELILQDLGFLGVNFNRELNASCPRGEEIALTFPDSKVEAWIIPTDEELVIARDTYALAK